MELMRYAAVIRSPWTWLGWPSVPTQDLWPERAQITSWWGKLEVDKADRKAIGLLD